MSFFQSKKHDIPNVYKNDNLPYTVHVLCKSIYIYIHVCLNPGMDPCYISLFCLDSFPGLFSGSINQKI